MLAVVPAGRVKVVAPMSGVDVSVQLNSTAVGSVSERDLFNLAEKRRLAPVRLTPTEAPTFKVACREEAVAGWEMVNWLVPVLTTVMMVLA